ncbi:MAG: hypothetical protein R2795_23040 [Saprospiraceae bacterium]
MKDTIGKVISVNESLVGVHYEDGAVANGEVAYVQIEDGRSLKSEVIEVKKGREVYLQVFEDTTWVKAGDPVLFSGKPLTVKLGPGILGSVTDGLQNPLYELAKTEMFLERGMIVNPLDTQALWHFTPHLDAGASVTGGDVLGTVPEKLFVHKIFIPFDLTGQYTIEHIAPAGDYRITQTIATIKDSAGKITPLSLCFDWPVKQSMPFHQRVVPKETLPTGVRIFDALFPIAYGGTACNPAFWCR